MHSHWSEKKAAIPIGSFMVWHDSTHKAVKRNVYMLESITLNNITNSLCMLLVPLQYSPTLIHTLSLSHSSSSEHPPRSWTGTGNAPMSGFLGGIMIVHNHLAEDLVEILTTGTTILPDIFMELVELIDPICCPSILGELGVTVFLLFACT